ncbi:MAG: DEDD exonuclease domain-containing protein [Propionibacteriaceae bacterium]|jgi:DNA polymerase-3 subunit epsilon|nr:DEDD exonuclease domain-containing protein [Propionibacteriaceae bacterium]
MTVFNPAQPMLDEFEFDYANHPLYDTTFCVIDLETTGTAHDSRITEIGAVKVRSGEVLGEFHSLINPGMRIPGFIESMTGISNTMVRSAPHLSQVFPSLVEFCRGSVMVAHNSRFDMGFITRACTSLGYEWPATLELDTLRIARHVIPRSEVPNYRLETLAHYFSTSVNPTHRALDDARTTVDLLHCLLERVGNQGVTTIGDLCEYSHMITAARRAKHVWAKDLPSSPGVYFFYRDCDHGRQLLYVGTSKNIRRRVSNYFTPFEKRRRMDEMVQLATGVEAVPCHTALEAAVVELRMITAHQPPYNRRSKQPRHCWIKTTREPIPRLSITRKVSNDGAAYLGPFAGKRAAEPAVLALQEAFPVRRCRDRLSATQTREPCALAEISSCPAPCTLTGLDAYHETITTVNQCLSGDIRDPRQACLSTISALSDQHRYEEAQEILDRLQVLEKGMLRQVRLTSLSSCPQILAARRLDQGWEIHVIRYGQLAGAVVAQVGDDPQRLAEGAVATAKTVTPRVEGQPAGTVEEAELIAAWMESDGVRLIDLDGIWGWPAHAH